MTESSASKPKRVVLRYEDNWEELRAQLNADRAVGLAPSTVRNDISAWLDEGSFAELGIIVRRGASSYRGGDDQEEEQGSAVPADGIITGWGRTGGRLVLVSADDTDLGSSVRGAAAAAKAHRVRRHALEQSAPLIQVLAADRIEPDTFIGAEFVRFGYGVDFDYERHSDDRILKIAIVNGPLTEQAAIEASWCHLTILAGPDAALHGHRGADALTRGFGDIVVSDLEAALALVDGALAHLPSNCFDGPAQPRVESSRSGDSILDDGWSYELLPRWCPSVGTRLGRIGGWMVGLIECLDDCVVDAPAGEKMLRLAEFCRAFRLPLVVSHRGLDHPTEPTSADIDAWGRLGSVLDPATTTVLEMARSGRTLTHELGVRPLWTVGPLAGPLIDQVATAGSAIDATIDALSALRRVAYRPDQDVRIKHRPRRTLQGE